MDNDWLDYCEFDHSDYDAHLENLATQFAKILAEKHISQGKTTPNCSDACLRPDINTYRRHFNKLNQPLLFAEF